MVFSLYSRLLVGGRPRLRIVLTGTDYRYLYLEVLEIRAQLSSQNSHVMLRFSPRRAVRLFLFVSSVRAF